MSAKVKLAAYVVLIALTAWFGHGFYARFHAGAAPQPVKAARHHKKRAKPPDVAANTNSPAAETNLALVNTNTADQTTNAATNALAETAGHDTNSAATSNAAPVTAAADDSEPKTLDHDVITGGPQGSTIAYMALFVLSAVGLGLLIAYDLTHAMGSKATDYLFDNITDGQRDPEYEKAEQAWADGNHLGAIQMLRDYYKRNPRQVHAALRIAEIYEKDLRNYLAAALEYEEVLKKKLPSDRWAWAAIHLCNLYSRLGQQDKTMALLRRIADEHPRTGAAKKARQKLGLPEPEDEAVEPAAAEDHEGEQAYDVETNKGEWHEPSPDEASTPQQEPKSNLPPGFRPKK